jgi:4'-phosphopantetheinyl transferase EntD
MCPARPRQTPTPLLPEDLTPLALAEVESFWSFDTESAGALLAEEHCCAEAFGPKRLEDFRHGRHCARQAMRLLGTQPRAVTIGPRREPVWPLGIVGSITHSAGAAGAAVARASRWVSVGIDLEPDHPVSPRIIRRICRPEELARLPANEDEALRTARQIFSMKEAAYKALWPQLQNFLGFQEFEVQFDAPGAVFRLIAHDGVCPAELARRVHGRWLRKSGWIASAAALEP